MHFLFPWLASLAILGLTACALGQSAPEQLCGRDILTTGDAWENVQVERYEFERILASGSLVLWPQRMAALVSHLRFMERRAQLPREQRDRIAIGVQLVAGRTLPSNQFALNGDAAGLRAELSQIEAGVALVGEQFPAEQLKPLIPLTHLLAPLPPQLHASWVKAPKPISTDVPLSVIFKLTAEGGGTARVSKCDAFLVATDGGDFQHIKALATAGLGEFSATFQPRQGGPYQLWISATHEQTGREELLNIDLAAPPTSPPGVANEVLVTVRAGIKVELRFVGGAPRGGEISVARLIFSRLDGQPMQPLEPVFGAGAHLIAFANHAQQAIPIRATGFAPQPELTGTVELDFRLRPPAAGHCHLFAEARIDGNDETLNFAFAVRPPR